MAIESDCPRCGRRVTIIGDRYDAPLCARCAAPVSAASRVVNAIVLLVVLALFGLAVWHDVTTPRQTIIEVRIVH